MTTRHAPKRLYEETDLEIVNGKTRLKRGRSGESKTPAAGERSACTPSGLQAKAQGNRSHAETTTRTLQNGSSPYRSKWEAAYAQQLDLEVKAGVVKAWRYESMSLKLAEGKRYRPDFLVQYPDGLEKPLTFVEVKGQWTKNRRDGLTHLKWAAQLYPMFTWILMWREAGQWESTIVRV